MASAGRLAKARQMWEDLEDLDGAGGPGLIHAHIYICMIQLKRREEVAEANRKGKRKAGHAPSLALELGGQSALFGGRDSNSFKKAMNNKGANVP